VHEWSIRIIIDSGSCNNLASTTLVEKLSLPTRAHPHLYHIQRLNDGGKIKVTRSVRVPFSLGSYSDYAEMLFLWKHALCYWIDLGNMILISLHHGRSNHYSFMFKGQKIIIHPMTPDQILKDDLTRAAKTAQQVKSTSPAPINLKSSCTLLFYLLHVLILMISMKLICLLCTCMLVHACSA
jgi:hypothetical protein